MAESFLIPEKDRREIARYYRNMLHAVDNILTKDDIKMSRQWIYQSIAKMIEDGDAMPTRRVIKHLRMAKVLVNEFGLGRSAILATVLYDSLLAGSETLESIEKQFGQSVSLIVHGLCRAHVS